MSVTISSACDCYELYSANECYEMCNVVVQRKKLETELGELIEEKQKLSKRIQELNVGIMEKREGINEVVQELRSTERKMSKGQGQLQSRKCLSGVCNGFMQYSVGDESMECGVCEKRACLYCHEIYQDAVRRVCKMLLNGMRVYGNKLCAKCC